MGIPIPLQSRRWSYILSASLYKAIGSNAKHDTDLQLVSFKDVKRRLQLCMIWTTEHENGVTGCENARKQATLVHKKVHASVKTRFGGVLFMLDWSIKCSKAVDITYGDADNADLCKRKPCHCHWAIAEGTPKVLMSLLKTRLDAEGLGERLLPDTIACIMETSCSPMEVRNLLVYLLSGAIESKICDNVITIIKVSSTYTFSHLSFLGPVDSGAIQYVGCMILDSQFVKLDLEQRFCHLNCIEFLAQTVQEYT